MRPFASAGVPGMTIFRPATFMNIGCGFSECCAAAAPDGPEAAKRTMGSWIWPPDMYGSFAAWLATWSMAT